MEPFVETCVAGAGVVGIAIARELALRGRSVLLLDADDGFGRGVSSRNSEVIHAGVFNPPEYLKSQLCIEGRHMLYAYADVRGVPHRRTGKLLVAPDAADTALLDEIEASACGQALRPEDRLVRLSAGEASALEPELRCEAALLSRATGIVDSHALMCALLGDAENAGATFVARTPVARVERRNDAFRIRVAADEAFSFDAAAFVNATGHGACALAAAIDGYPGARIPEASMMKGNYYSLAGHSPFDRLIYPVQQGGRALHQGGHSLHLTLDLAGRARFGPDAEPCSTLDFTVDPGRASLFYAGIRRYWPGLPEGALQPESAGVRPKVRPPAGMDIADFVIDGPPQHGIPGLVQLFGIESPGLTSSMAIGARVADLLA